MPKSDYSHTLAVSDVFLDTPYYGELPLYDKRSFLNLQFSTCCDNELHVGAHTTASDALFGTLPVITLPRHTVSFDKFIIYWLFASQNCALGCFTGCLELEQGNFASSYDYFIC